MIRLEKKSCAFEMILNMLLPKLQGTRPVIEISIDIVSTSSTIIFLSSIKNFLLKSYSIRLSRDFVNGPLFLLFSLRFHCYPKHNSFAAINSSINLSRFIPVKF